MAEVSESEAWLSEVRCDARKSSWLGNVNSASRADNAASILWTSFRACMTSLEVAFSEEVAGVTRLSDAFSLPLLLPEAVEGADADADAEAGVV